MLNERDLDIVTSGSSSPNFVLMKTFGMEIFHEWNLCYFSFVGPHGLRAMGLKVKFCKVLKLRIFDSNFSSFSSVDSKEMFCGILLRHPIPESPLPSSQKNKLLRYLEKKWKHINSITINYKANLGVTVMGRLWECHVKLPRLSHYFFFRGAADGYLPRSKFQFMRKKSSSMEFLYFSSSLDG